jgi:hypothetical protein
VVEWCCMYKTRKSIDHLFHHCEVARELWSTMFSLFGVEWVMPRNVVRVVRL